MRPKLLQEIEKFTTGNEEELAITSEGLSELMHYVANLEKAINDASEKLEQFDANYEWYVRKRNLGTGYQSLTKDQWKERLMSL